MKTLLELFKEYNARIDGSNVECYQLSDDGTKIEVTDEKYGDVYSIDVNTVATLVNGELTVLATDEEDVADEVCLYFFKEEDATNV